MIHRALCRREREEQHPDHDVPNRAIAYAALSWREYHGSAHGFIKEDHRMWRMSFVTIVYNFVNAIRKRLFCV